MLQPTADMDLSTEALVVREKGARPRLEPVKIRDVRPDEVLVDIHAVGICHTDISCINNVIPIDFPAVLGHEGDYLRSLRVCRQRYVVWRTTSN